MNDAEPVKRRFLVIFFAGFGDSKRFAALGFEVRQAIKDTTGRMPVAVMLSAFADAQAWALSASDDVDTLRASIVRRLPRDTGVRFTGLTNPDRMIICEVTAKGLATAGPDIKDMVLMG